IAYAYGTDSTNKVGDPVPYNGYFFRILTSQGPHASGGAKSYIAAGLMTRGFAFIAYPAEYRSSGVMTFIVDESGTVYEKDLGPDTTKIAEAVTAYDAASTSHQTAALCCLQAESGFALRIQSKPPDFGADCRRDSIPVERSALRERVPF